MRHTKIVCTIGPACDSKERLRMLIRAGMDVARLNTSHASKEEIERRIDDIREVAGEEKANVAILLDLRGPKIRLGKIPNGPVELKQGEKVILTTENVEGSAKRIPVNYAQLTQEVKPGNTILLADGLVGLTVLDVTEKEVICEVKNDGEISSHKGVNLPGVKTHIPILTDHDLISLELGITKGVDFVAASFVRRAEDILSVRKVLEDAGVDIHIIAKIETWEAVRNLDDVIQVSDGIMVARGDLGLEIPPEEVPLVQKRIIFKCNRNGKPVITATQMLESMIHNPRPTRAEASDVANAILDGTDAVMLSAETAVGDYPVEAVATMARISLKVEEELPYETRLYDEGFNITTVTDAISYATCSTAADLGAAAIITSTQTGYTARMVAKYRPNCPIIAVTPQVQVQRRLNLVYGVKALLVEPIKDTDGMIAASIEAALQSGLIKGGDLVVITAGVPVGMHGTTNLLKVHTVGTVLAQGMGLGDKAVTGTVKIAHNAEEAREKVSPGDILVAPATDRDFVPAMKIAGGIVTEVSGLTSHAAIVGLQFGLPVIVGVEDATKVLSEGETITIDGQRGLIYSGFAKVL
ncbi:MAG: pyruvate kinase [Peptococcaceae bacterium]|nr:pyruvate kinase [Peptococcaceae bacterium]